MYAARESFPKRNIERQQGSSAANHAAFRAHQANALKIKNEKRIKKRAARRIKNVKTNGDRVFIYCSTG
mgnify:CR=1 FL=1